jgi:uncharacterized protein (DUF2141 family)
MRAFMIACAGAMAFLPFETVQAADLVVRIEGLRSTAGLVRVAVCPQDSFTTAKCPHSGAAEAASGVVVVKDVPDGIYAVQAFHDEDGDGDLDRNGFWPLEGMGFSRDAPMRLGPPRFRDAAVAITGDATVTLKMRYHR